MLTIAAAFVGTKKRITLTIPTLKKAALFYVGIFCTASKSKRRFAN